MEVGDGGRFLVNGEEGYGAFDGVVVAVGTCGRVSVPCIPGLEDFGGRTCRSSRLRSVDVRGKKVVVVGGGASAVEAMEFAVDHGAESVAVVTRVSLSGEEDSRLPFERRADRFVAAVREMGNPTLALAELPYGRRHL